LREIFLGVESGSADQIRRYGKSATATQNMRAINLLNNLGIQTDIGFIMFDPEMSLEDLKYNVAFIRHAGLANHDARMNKKVRIEPFTEFEQEMRERGIIGRELDINDVTFPYEMQDERVRLVYGRFSAWERIAEKVVYRLQARSMGECVSEEERLRDKRYLGFFRQLDLEFLEACIEAVENGIEEFERRLTGQLEAFSERRAVLIANIPAKASLCRS